MMSRSLAVPPVERLPESWEIPRSMTSRRPSRQRCTRGARGIRGAVTPSLNCSVLSHDSVLPLRRGGDWRREKAAAAPARLLFMKKPASPSGGRAGMRQILHKQRQEERGADDGSKRATTTWRAQKTGGTVAMTEPPAPSSSGPCGDRTRDPRIKSPMLCQLS